MSHQSYTLYFFHLFSPYSAYTSRGRVTLNLADVRDGFIESLRRAVEKSAVCLASLSEEDRPLSPHRLEVATIASGLQWSDGYGYCFT